MKGETALDLLDRLCETHLPVPEPISPDEWADEFRELARESSAEPGRWSTDRTPYMRQIMQDLAEGSGYEEITLQFGTQLGKSESGNNWIGCVIDRTPGPTMLIQPTIDLAKRYSKHRIAPMIKSTPALRTKVREARSRDSGNTTLVKEFPGGILVITGANSASGLASMPSRNVFADEIDDWPADVGGQGDPLALVVARQDSFGQRRKLLASSSPKRAKGFSPIESRYLSGTRFRYQVPCPDCGHYQVLEWGGPEAKSGLKYLGDDEDLQVFYVCSKCGVTIDETRKTRMLSRGVWVAENPESKHRSYHLSSLYSPQGWASWIKIVREYLVAIKAAAAGDGNKLKAWRNMRLAETIKEEGLKLDANWLRDRADIRPLHLVPDECLVLTAGVDVQANRLELSVWAHGPAEISAPIDHLQIYGDPAQLERLAPDQLTVWERLDAALEHRYRHASGNTLAVEAVAVDTGGTCTHAVYSYCRARQNVHVNKGAIAWVRRTFAIKGADRPGLAIKSKAKPMDINWRGQIIKEGVKLWEIGVGTAKDYLYSHLKVQTRGPGYVILSNELTPEWFEQMTSEQNVMQVTGRGQRKVWVLEQGKRNEAWDCAVYALFCAHALDLHRFTAEMWARIRERVCPMQATIFAEPAPAEPGVIAGAMAAVLALAQPVVATASATAPVAVPASPRPSGRRVISRGR